MKNLKIVILMTALLVGLASPSFAVLRKDLGTLKGSVVYISANRAEITVKDVTTGKETIFTGRIVDPGISIGNEVLVMYKRGTTNATSIRLVQRRGKAAAMGGGMAAPAPAAAKKAWY